MSYKNTKYSSKNDIPRGKRLHLKYYKTEDAKSSKQIHHSSQLEIKSIDIKFPNLDSELNYWSTRDTKMFQFLKIN